jgi:hypothetical protein
VGQPRLPLELARRSVSGAQRGRPRRSAIEALPREHTRVERANPSGANAQLMRTALGLFIFRREPKLGNRWLGGVDVEPVDEALDRIAGEVLGGLRLGREHTIDAIVMASAAQRGTPTTRRTLTIWRGWRRGFPACGSWALAAEAHARTCDQVVIMGR